MGGKLSLLIHPRINSLLDYLLCNYDFKSFNPYSERLLSTHSGLLCLFYEAIYLILFESALVLIDSALHVRQRYFREAYSYRIQFYVNYMECVKGIIYERKPDLYPLLWPYIVRYQPVP